MLAGPVAEALADTPVVVVVGPRQAGKSTLAEHVVADRAGTWLTLDDATILDTARAAPSRPRRRPRPASAMRTASVDWPS